MRILIPRFQSRFAKRKTKKSIIEWRARSVSRVSFKCNKSSDCIYISKFAVTGIGSYSFTAPLDAD